MSMFGVMDDIVVTEIIMKTILVQVVRHVAELWGFVCAALQAWLFPTAELMKPIAGWPSTHTHSSKHCRK